MLYHTPALFYGVLPYPELLKVLCEKEPGRRESSTGPDAVVPTGESEVGHLAAGRVIVRDEEGRLALSSFRFLPLGG